MKKTFGFLTILLGAVIFPKVVSAEASFDIDCDPTTVRRGQTVTCTINMTSADSKIKDIELTVYPSTESQLVYESSGVTTNTFWTNNSNGTKLKFTYTGDGNVVTPSQIATFAFKVPVDATECGKVCYRDFKYDNGQNSADADNCISLTLNLEGTTPSGTTPSSTTTTPSEQTPSEENPQTGSFIPFVVIGSATILAIAAISVATKKNKFYNI